MTILWKHLFHLLSYHISKEFQYALTPISSCSAAADKLMVPLTNRYKYAQFPSQSHSVFQSLKPS